MKCCTLFVDSRTGTGAQTVTGVVDRDGNPFIGKAFIFQGSTFKNVISYWAAGGGHLFSQYDGAIYNSGYDGLTASTRLSNGFGDGDLLGIKQNSGGSAGDHSLLYCHTQAAFGGAIRRMGYITAVRSGEFDLQYDVNSTDPDTFNVTILGGDDLDVSFQRQDAFKTITPGFTPVVALLKNQLLFSSSAISGGGGASWGWALDDGSQMSMGTQLVDLGTNWSAYFTDKPVFTINNTTGAISSTNTITFGPSSWSYVNNVPGIGAPLTLGGCVAACGTITQPSVTGFQTYTPGIDPKFIFIVGTGGTASGVADNLCSVSTGVSDTVRQSAYWTAEREKLVTAPGFAGNPKSARYIDNTNIIVYGTSANASSTIDVTAKLSDIDSETGTFTLHWTKVDGTSRQWLWLVIGDPTVTPTPPTPPPTIDIAYGPGPSVGEVNRWLLHRFDTKIRQEESS
jgi:hypothetical protein